MHHIQINGLLFLNIPSKLTTKGKTGKTPLQIAL